MTRTPIENHPHRSRAAWRAIPPLMRVLFVANRQRTGGWLAEAFSAEKICDLRLEEVLGSTAGMTRLRDDTFDAVLVSHDPPELNALELIEGYRAGGAARTDHRDGAAERAGNGGSLLRGRRRRIRLCQHDYVAQPDLGHRACRAAPPGDAGEPQADVGAAAAASARTRRGGTVASPAADAGRRSGGDPEPFDAGPDEGGGPAKADGEAVPRERLQLPRELVLHYRELLRAYVIMGSGNLACELSRLAELLVTAGISARQTMQLHVLVLEELVGGFGSRSTRHVMTRADLLVLEIMVHLADNYRDRYRERIHAPVQQLLPGFEELCAERF